MKKLIYIAVLLAAAISCKKESVADYTQRETEFDAWITAQTEIYNLYPNAREISMGVWILEDQPGEGEWNMEEEPCIFINYIRENLEGYITSTSDEKTAGRIGIYSKTGSYGAYPWKVTSGLAGVEIGMEGMKVGGKRKIAVPSWLMTNDRYDTEAEYKKKETDTDAAVFTITLVKTLEDFTKYEIELLEKDSKANMKGADSTWYAGDEDLGRFGFYFMSKNLPEGAEEITSDENVHIYYTARRLTDGGVFDTNIADTAIKYNFYDPSNAYSPAQINWTEDWDDLTMGTDASDLIDGFKSGLYLMHHGESARFSFYSTLGYGLSGVSYAVLPYTPLAFDVEIIQED